MISSGIRSVSLLLNVLHHCSFLGLQGIVLDEGRAEDFGGIFEFSQGVKKCLSIL